MLEIESAIDALSFAERAELECLLDAAPGIPYPPGGLDLEVDSPELEAELLKSANQPHEPFKPEELRAMCEQLAVELRGKN